MLRCLCCCIVGISTASVCVAPVGRPPLDRNRITCRKCTQRKPPRRRRSEPMTNTLAGCDHRFKPASGCRRVVSNGTCHVKEDPQLPRWKALLHKCSCRERLAFQRALWGVQRVYWKFLWNRKPSRAMVPPASRKEIQNLQPTSVSS